MSILDDLGNGYFGVEAANISTQPDAFHAISKVFQDATSIPDDAISITKYEPEKKLPRELIAGRNW